MPQRVNRDVSNVLSVNDSALDDSEFIDPPESKRSNA